MLLYVKVYQRHVNWTNWVNAATAQFSMDDGNADYIFNYNLSIRLEGPEDPHRTNSRFLRSRDPAHASLPLAQTPWGLTGRAWLQAGAQQVAIVVSHN